MAGWVGGITGGSGVNSKSGADQEKTEPQTFLLQVGRQNEGPPGLALEDPPATSQGCSTKPPTNPRQDFSHASPGIQASISCQDQICEKLSADRRVKAVMVRKCRKAPGSRGRPGRQRMAPLTNCSSDGSPTAHTSILSNWKFSWADSCGLLYVVLVGLALLCPFPKSTSTQSPK